MFSLQYAQFSLVCGFINQLNVGTVLYVPLQMISICANVLCVMYVFSLGLEMKAFVRYSRGFICTYRCILVTSQRCKKVCKYWHILYSKYTLTSNLGNWDIWLKIKQGCLEDNWSILLTGSLPTLSSSVLQHITTYKILG